MTSARSRAGAALDVLGFRGMVEYKFIFNLTSLSTSRHFGMPNPHQSLIVNILLCFFFQMGIFARHCTRPRTRPTEFYVAYEAFFFCFFHKPYGVLKTLCKTGVWCTTRILHYYENATFGSDFLTYFTI
jgi:hypothetical protein